MTVESQMAELSKDLALELVPKIAHSMGFPIPPEITRIVLKAFIGLLTEEKKNSERINSLVESYYKVGIECLTDSGLAEDPGERKRLITVAIDKFRTASHVEGILLVVKSQFYIGTCYDLLQEVRLAKSHHEQAYTLAYQQAMQLTRKARVETVSWPFGNRKMVEMDEATRIKWWNMFKDLGPDDLVSESETDQLFGRGFEWAREHPEEFKAMMEYQMNKVKMSTFFASVWISLSERERDEIMELRDFSNFLVPVLRAHNSTIVP